MSQTKAQLISDLVQALNFTGTSSAPANGAFLSAANTLALATNSVRRLTIDSSGNVGIGISASTPSAKFEVQTSASERIHFLSNGANEQPRIDLIRDSGTDYSIINAIGAYQIKKGSNLIYQYASDSHRFSIDGSEKARIDSSGNVGIGTNAPDVRLDVARLGNAWTGQDPIAGTVVHLHNGNNGSSSAAYLGIGAGTGTESGINFGDADDADAGRIRYNHASDHMHFSTGALERLRITSSGKVGIGETSPDTLLHLKDSSPRIHLEDTGTNAVFRINADSSVGNAALEVDVNSDTSTPSFITTIKGSEKMRLNSSGNLGIGTGSSINSRLHVFGTSGTYPTVQINHSAADTEGEFLRISRTDVTTIRYHSIKATHSGAAISNRLALLLHDGSGDPFTGQREVVRLRGDGRIGIGTTAPVSAIEMRTSEASGLILRQNNTQSTNTNKAFRIRNNSNADTVNISWTGILTAQTVNETSDIALKENIQPLSNTLEKIKQITGYRYNFKDSETNSVGVIAQDVEKVFPELVHGEEGTKKLQYSGLVGALIEAVKELSDKVATLETA